MGLAQEGFHLEMPFEARRDVDASVNRRSKESPRSSSTEPFGPIWLDTAYQCQAA